MAKINNFDVQIQYSVVAPPSDANLNEAAQLWPSAIYWRQNHSCTPIQMILKASAEKNCMTKTAKI